MAGRSAPAAGPSRSGDRSEGASSFLFRAISQPPAFLSTTDRAIRLMIPGNRSPSPLSGASLRIRYPEGSHSGFRASHRASSRLSRAEGRRAPWMTTVSLSCDGTQIRVSARSRAAARRRMRSGSVLDIPRLPGWSGGRSAPETPPGGS